MEGIDRCTGEHTAVQNQQNVLELIGIFLRFELLCLSSRSATFIALLDPVSNERKPRSRKDFFTVEMKITCGLFYFFYLMLLMCLCRKCFAAFDLLLLARFSPQIRPHGQPLSSEIDADECAQASLIFYFLQIFVFSCISLYLASVGFKVTAAGFIKCDAYFKQEITKYRKI